MSKLFSIITALTISISVHAENLKINIGVVVPLTGSAASNGVTVKNSILLAQEDLDPEHKINFIFEDDQFVPKNTISAVKKLIQSDKVAGLIVYGSHTSLAVNGIAEKDKVPMIALSIVRKVVEEYSYVTKLWVSAKVENDRIVQEVKRRGYKKVASVATINDAMLSLQDHFNQDFAANIIGSDELNREETDLRPIVLRIINRKPDAVYNLLWTPQPGLFAKLLRDGGYSGPIFGAHNLEDPNEIKVSSGALDGAWFVTGDDSTAGEYLNKYRALYHTDPTAGGANAYDAAKLYMEAVQTSDVNRFLHEVKNFRGAYGVYSASGSNDYTIRARVKRIQNGAIVAESVGSSPK